MKISQLKTFVQVASTLPVVNSTPVIKTEMISVRNEILAILNEINIIAKKHAQESLDADLDAANPFPEILSDYDQTNIKSKINTIRLMLTKLDQDLNHILKPKSPTIPQPSTPLNLAPANILSPEKINALRQKLSAEYDQHLEFLHFLELLPKEGSQEFTSTVTGKTYKLPEKQEVIEQWFTPEKLALIAEMEEQGLKPELKIFPLLTLAELKAKIDTKYAELKGPGISNFVGLSFFTEIKGAKLNYAPSQVKASPEGKNLIVEGGINQAEWIDLNQGFIIEAVPTVKGIPVKEELQKDQNEKWLYVAQQAANLWQDAQSKGLSSLSYVESAILGAEAVKRGKPIENGSFTILLESNLIDSNYVSTCRFHIDVVSLAGCYANHQYSDLRGRFSVRGKRPTENPSTHSTISETTDLSPEVKEIAEALAQDYQQVIKAFRHFGIRTKDPLYKTKKIFTPLIQEDPEKPGIYFYEADYDGTLEKIPAKNFTGERFNMPTLEECLKSITPEQVKLYQEMAKAGKEPKLRLTPVGYRTATLANAIDSRMVGTGDGEISILTSNTHVNEDLKDEDLICEPEDIEAIDGDQKVKITGGKPMSQQIEENQGWKIELIENVQELEADTDKTLDPATKDPKTGKMLEYTLAKKQELYFRDAESKGQTGLSYKSCLAAQMCNLIDEEPKPFDQTKWNILSESCFTDSSKFPRARWYVGRVRLDWYLGSLRRDRYRFRRSVSVKRLKT